MSVRDNVRFLCPYRVHDLDDWLVMTSSEECTFSDQGILAKALELYWLGSCNGLPSDLSDLARMLGSSVEEATSLLQHTSGHEIIDGRIHWAKERDRFNNAGRYDG